MGTVQLYVEPPRIPLIKSKNNYNLDKYFIDIKLCRGLVSEKSYLYKFKIALFDNGGPEELFLFVRNFSMTLEASGKIKSGANI